jgi:hypothetical protein
MRIRITILPFLCPRCIHTGIRIYDKEFMRVEKREFAYEFSQLSCMRVDWMQILSSELSSTLMQLLFSFDRGMRVEKTLMQTLASQLSSTLMQLLFSFDRGMRVEKTLMQTLASQLSSTLIQLLFSFHVWPGHESWENSHANSSFSTLITYSHSGFVPAKHIFSFVSSQIVCLRKYYCLSLIITLPLNSNKTFLVLHVERDDNRRNAVDSYNLDTPNKVNRV